MSPVGYPRYCRRLQSKYDFLLPRLRLIASTTAEADCNGNLLLGTATAEFSRYVITTMAINDFSQTDTVNALPDSGNEIVAAVNRGDWARLRELSLLPHGFQGHRHIVWPFLLHAKLADPLPSLLSEDTPPSEESPHEDERQISLDVDRSFIIYPQVEQPSEKEEMQDRLNHLIVTFLRRRPSMSYFQGYHDIVSVLMLSLPLELQSVCTEKMSLQRLRDAMGKGLEPLIGQLRLLRNLLRLVDPEYAKILEHNTPLPYFSLSHLLTLFSHDVPTLAQIQHVFDYLLCREPLAAVHLSAQVLFERREATFRLIKEGEDGMLHSLLSSWPVMEDGPLRTSLRLSPSQRTSHMDGNNTTDISPDEKNTPATSPLALKIDDVSSQSPPAERLHKLLVRTEELRSMYPATLPELKANYIFGPSSVITTWSEKSETLPSDDKAEHMVDDQDLVVYPYIPTPLPSDDEGDDEKRRRRRRRKTKSVGLRFNSRFMAAGALVLLSIVFAYYNDPANGGMWLLWNRLVYRLSLTFKGGFGRFLQDWRPR